MAHMHRDEAMRVLALHGFNALGMDSAGLRKARRALVARLHPDRGGSTATMQEVLAACASLEAFLAAEAARAAALAAAPQPRPVPAWRNPVWRAHAWFDGLPDERRFGVFLGSLAAMLAAPIPVELVASPVAGMMARMAGMLALCLAGLSRVMWVEGPRRP